MMSERVGAGERKNSLENKTTSFYTYSIGCVASPNMHNATQICTEESVCVCV